MCRVLAVSAIGFYAWRERATSPRSIANAVVTYRIRQIRLDSHASCGVPWICAEHMKHLVLISRQCVARPMREARILGIS